MYLLRKIARFFRRIPIAIQKKSSELKLKKLHPDQFARFNDLKTGFLGVYNNFNKTSNSNFQHETWAKFSDEILSEMKPIPTISFFNNPSLTKTMTNEALSIDVDEFIFQINEYSSGFLPDDFYEEDLVGVPILLKNHSSKRTSLGRIVHLYQAALSSNITGNLKNVDTVTEWGGGFGGLSRLVKKINQNITYNIVDIPISCSIQWLYLSSILGEDSINLVTSKDSEIQKGKINLIPIGLVSDLKDNLNCDLFVSSWAISESDKAAQDFVIDTKFFNSKHSLIIFQRKSSKHPYSENIYNYIRQSNNFEFKKVPVPIWNKEIAVFW